MTKINQIAQAFAQGVKFAENLKLAMDAAEEAYTKLKKRKALGPDAAI